jgi:HD-GYP domain-containing protein (c-di-GMP phosphodiesterase class II)
MLFSPEPEKDIWVDNPSWRARNLTQNILVPLEAHNSQFITGYVVLDERGFPEGGQNTLFDYASGSFREGCTSLAIHHELGDPSLEDGYTIALLKLAHSIDNCNVFSRNHAVKTAFWARSISEKLGFSSKELEQIELASKLHDVGKVVVPKNVLTKPSPLNEEEWLMMKRHPTFGAMLMKPASRLHPLIPFVESHHEKYDGTGYPLHLAGEQIPIQARIISVADSYATITDGRVYRAAGSRSQAMQELHRCSGGQFDPKIIEVITNLVESGDVDDSNCTWGNLGSNTIAST